MKCLYCGKDVPLLKRLAKGEFCSDEHRLSYQQEYSQLALNRLLQTYSPEDARKAAKAESKVELTEKAAPKLSSESRTAPVEKAATEHSVAPSLPARSASPRPAALVPHAPVAPHAPVVAHAPVAAHAKDARSLPTATIEIHPQPVKTIEPAPKPSRKPEPKPMLSELPSAPHARVPENHTHAPTPKLTLSLNQSSPVNSIGPANPGRTKKATPSAVSEDGRPEPKRWSAPKTGMVALAQAVSHVPPDDPSHVHDRAQEHPQEPVQETTSLAHSTTADLPAQEASPANSSSPTLTHEPAHDVTNDVTHEATQEFAAESSLPPTAAAESGGSDTEQQPPLAENVFLLPPGADEPFRLRRTAETLISSLTPALPRANINPLPSNVRMADCLSSSTFVEALKLPLNSRSVRLEFREFARRELVFEFRSTVQGPRLDLATQPAALPFTPVTPRPTPLLWVGPALEFPPIEDHSQATAALHLPLPERPAAIAVPVEGPAGTSSKQSESPVKLDVAADPEPILTSLPMAFEGIPGGRAKPVQVFASTLRAAAVVDVPRYEALPMRAMIVVERVGALRAPAGNGNGGTEESVNGWLKTRGESSFLLESFEGLEEPVGSRIRQKP